MVARFDAKPCNIAVVQVYAPTADSSDEDIEEFYKQLEKVLKELPRKDVKLIIGDWNAKVGTDNDGYEAVMGRYGYGQRNARGERLLEFALHQEMVICNTRYQKKRTAKADLVGTRWKT